MTRRWLSAILLTGTALAARAVDSPHPAEPVLRVAQVESEFEATDPPSVTLEEPETLERTGEPATAEALPEVPPGPPQHDAPVPEWWKQYQSGLDQAMRDETDSAGEPAQPETSRDGQSAPRTLGESIVKGSIALCVVVALILLSTYAVRRLGARTPLLAGASLGTVLGKVYLTPKIALHFVKVRNVVLVIGVTPTEVSPVAQLSAALFDEVTQPSATKTHDDRQMDFLSHLNDASGLRPARLPENEDDEIAALKGDIARLQQYLQETSRELGD